MAISHTEIVELLAEEIESIARACVGRVQRRKRVAEEDDDYATLVSLLDQDGDRKVLLDETTKALN